MAYVIAEPCVDVMDQACVDVCPVDCIHFEEGKDRMLYIEPDECIDCGACEPECPVEAIFTEEDVPDEWKPYTEINVQWFNDKDAARAKINEIRRTVYDDGCARPGALGIRRGGSRAQENYLGFWG